MRLILTLLLLLLCTACFPVKKDSSVAQIGDRVEAVYVKDSYTGKCIKVDGVGKYNLLTVVLTDRCRY